MSIAAPAAGSSGSSAGRRRLRRSGGRMRPLAAVEVAALLALSVFAAAHWATLLADPPIGRTLLAVALAVAAGLAAARLPLRLPRPATAPIAVALALVGAAGGLAALGVPAAVLVPGGWPELADGVARGFTGIRTLEWPYAGPDPWVRLTILSAIPVVVTVASMLAFWPLARGRELFRAYALVALVALYGGAMAEIGEGATIDRGLVLLVLIALWVLAPRVRRGGARPALAAVALAAAVSLPVAAAVRAEEPLVDYESWRPFGEVTTFRWDHTYGPIDWPRRGETVFTIESSKPHYWRATTLGYFDGRRWVDGDAASSRPSVAAGDRWEAESTVTVGSVDTSRLVAAGTIAAVEGIPEPTIAADGTAAAEAALDQGEIYTVRAYAPDPSARRMRAADPAPAAVAFDAPDALYAADTAIHLPDADQATAPPVLVGGTSAARDALLVSPYARMYRLARRLAAPAATTYDAVRRIESHLRQSYEYDERPPEHDYPLAAFLFEDRRGYCQQFSGAMALMLRMNGIPARVAAGFSPGSLGVTGEYTVRDLDAHSWVEVHFEGIGWVPFDPTPAAAPAASRAGEDQASAARGDRGRPADDLAEALALGGAGEGPSARAGAAPDPPAGAAEDARAAEGGGAAAAGPLAAVLAAVALVGAAALLRRRRSASPDHAVAELRTALERLGHALPAAATLAQIERLLEGSGRHLAAAHAARLREERYAPAGARRVPLARGALRRALTEGSGAVGRLRGYLALPPI